MIWSVEFDDRARRELRKLDKQAQQEILSYLREKIATSEDVKRFGKPLVADKQGLWRYRISDYRIICRIENEQLVVLVVRVGHRKNVYENKLNDSI
ncbi:type II toxin-antitoxin system RelE/ParE family toxin [Deltaproteobacteria bacterium TL4]